MVISMEKTLPGGEEMLRERSLLLNREHEKEGKNETSLYEKELDAYSCVARGDCENVGAAFSALISQKAGGAPLGENEKSTAKYRAAEIVNIAARYAAQSGFDEAFYLDFADNFVREADKIENAGEIYLATAEKAAELTQLVRKEKDNRRYPYIIRTALGYIDSNIDRSITVIDVSRVCRISPDYLSAYFKKTTGVSMTAYIRRQKLLLAKEMLKKSMRCGEVSKRLSFCSESYFVKCFKDEFGLTPKKWQNTC